MPFKPSLLTEDNGDIILCVFFKRFFYGHRCWRLLIFEWMTSKSNHFTLSQSVPKLNGVPISAKRSIYLIYSQNMSPHLSSCGEGEGVPSTIVSEIQSCRRAVGTPHWEGVSRHALKGDCRLRETRVSSVTKCAWKCAGGFVPSACLCRFGKSDKQVGRTPAIILRRRPTFGCPDPLASAERWALHCKNVPDTHVQLFLQKKPSPKAARNTPHAMEANQLNNCCVMGLYLIYLESIACLSVFLSLSSLINA